MERKQFDILLVEDNPADILLMEEALEDIECPCRLTSVTTGDEALALLRRQGTFAGRPLPDLILLDLNLPGRHGHEILAEIKDDGSLKHLPVVVFSTSDSEKDIFTSYRLQASSHVAKPSGLMQYIRLVQALVSYWHSTVRLPQTAPCLIDSRRNPESHG